MSKIFSYHSKVFKNSEAIGKCNAISNEEAVAVFAAKKKLSIDDFLIIYKVKEYENNKISNTRN